MTPQQEKAMLQRQVAEEQRAEAVRRRKQVEAEAARKAAPKKKAVKALFEACAVWWYVATHMYKDMVMPETAPGHQPLA
jgi:hypothetical protein